VKIAASKFALFLIVTAILFAGCSGHPRSAPSVTITGLPATVVPNQTFTLTGACINDGSNGGVTWALTGAGTFTSTTTTFVYTAPDSVPENPVVTITATCASAPAAVSTVTFNIQAATAPTLSFLMGPFAFEATGFDASGNALIIAGSFTSDGMGNIGPGEIDVNDNFTMTHTTNVQGTYILDGNLRGVITLTTPLGSAFSTTPTFAFTIDSNTSTGTIVSVDTAESAVSGLLAAQNSAVFSATPSGSFIFRGTSDAAGVRGGAVGRFTIGAGGVISNGLVDSVDIGQGNDSVDDTLTGTFQPAGGAGRGLIQLQATQSGLAVGQFAFYAVSANEIFLVEIDNEAPGQFVDVARTQATLSPSSVNGTGVFGLIGADDDADTEIDQITSAAIGQITITGGNTVSIVCDVNDAKDVTQCSTNGGAPTPVPGTVTFDPTTGRGTLTIANGFNDGFVDSATFYLEANGTGVMMDTTEPNAGGSLPEALVGDLIPQTSTSDIVGEVQGVGLTGDNEAFAIAGIFNITGDGGVSGIFDGSGPDEDPIMDSSITGQTNDTDSTGRTTFSVSGTLFGGTDQPAASFSASPNQYFVIVEAQGVDTDLGIFTPQALPTQDAVKVKSNNKSNATPKRHTRKLNPALAAKHQRRFAVKVQPKTLTPHQQQ
jgi:hypothetical protein